MTRLVTAILTVLVATSFATIAEARQQSDQQAVVAREPTSRYPDLGPEMQAYMGFIDAEEAELKHLYDVGEVPPADYRLQLDRLVVTREAALRVERSRANDVVPDLYILIESELTQILPAGVAAVRGKRAGVKLDDVWMYHGTIRRGETFYILERVGGLGHEP